MEDEEYRDDRCIAPVKRKWLSHIFLSITFPVPAFRMTRPVENGFTKVLYYPKRFPQRNHNIPSKETIILIFRGQGRKTVYIMAAIVILFLKGGKKKNLSTAARKDHVTFRNDYICSKS